MLFLGFLLILNDIGTSWHIVKLLSNNILSCFAFTFVFCFIFVPQMDVTMKRIAYFLFFVIFSQTVCAQNWEVNTVRRINSWDSGFVRNYNKVVSKTAPYVAVSVPVAMAAVALINDNQDLLEDAVYVGTSVAGAVAVTYGMKYLFDRRRPYEKYPDRIHPFSLEDSPSFPSGHTSTAFALATSLSIRYPKWYVIAPSALWACSVGVSRMNEGVHYPTDVLAGAALGAGCAVANIYINRWLNRWLFGN